MTKQELQDLLNLTTKKLAIATKNIQILKNAEKLIYNYRSRAYEAERELNKLQFDSSKFKTLSQNYDGLMHHFTLACEAAQLPKGEFLYKHILKMKERISELEKTLGI